MALTGKTGVDAVIEMDLAANAKLYPGLLRPRGHVVVYGTGSAEAAIPAQPLLVNAIKIEFIFVYELTAAEREAAVTAINRMLENKTLINNVALTLAAQRHRRRARGGRKAVRSWAMSSSRCEPSILNMPGGISCFVCSRSRALP